MRSFNQRSTSMPSDLATVKASLIGDRCCASNNRLKLGGKRRAKSSGLRNHCHGFVEKAVSDGVRQTHLNVTDHLFRRPPKIIRNQKSSHRVPCLVHGHHAIQFSNASFSPSGTALTSIHVRHPISRVFKQVTPAGVCTENLIRVDSVMESPKLAE